MADIMLLRVSEELNRKLCLEATQMRKTRNQLAGTILQEWIDNHAEDAQTCRKEAATSRIPSSRTCTARAIASAGRGWDHARKRAADRPLTCTARPPQADVQTNGRRPPQCRQGNPSA